METLRIIQIGVALATVMFGVIVVIRPRQIAKMFDLIPTIPIGEAEFRLIWGVMFIGFGLGVIVLNDVAAYRLLGIGYGVTAAARLVLIMRNRNLLTRVTALAFTFELVSAIIFLLP